MPTRCLATVLIGLALSSPALAQTSKTFAGAAVTLAGTQGAVEDSAGFGTITPNFHDVTREAVIGAHLTAGRRVTSQWSVGVELAFHRARTSRITEASRTHFEFTEIQGDFSHRDTMLSVVARHRLGGTSLTIEPLGGVTFARRTRTITDRAGTYTYHAGVLPIDGDDISNTESKAGIVFGVDLVRPGKSVSVALIGRVHRFASEPRPRTVPRLPPWATTLGAGIRWN